jgi:antitoxin (DNA-binding transcriptional repressor) of toxin-antitoxin stability system
MIAVGVRQLKNSLTRYLRLVESGQSVVVTSRNRPVAVLKQPDRRSARTQEERVAALVAEGKLLPAANPGPFRPFKPVRVKGKLVSRIIIEGRR